MSATRSADGKPGQEPQAKDEPSWDRNAMRSGAALRALLKRRHRSAPAAEEPPAGQSRQPGQPLDLRPGCVYGVVTRERVDDLTNELREIKARLNYLFSLVAGAIIIDVLLRISGLG